MEKHIFLFGEIGGWGISSADVLKDIAAAKSEKAEKIVVQISSFGGYVYDGKAIYAALKASGIPVRVEIIGQAFSIASYIAMAGDEILIAPTGEMMIHPAWTFAEGNADDLREMADELEKMSEEIFNVYLERGADEATIRPYFDEEKIMTADEAVAAGLATGLLEPMKAVAKFKKINNSNSTMEKNTVDKILNALEALSKKIGLKAKNESVTAADGTVMYFDGDTLVEGTAVFANEEMTEPTPDGTYEYDGNTITVTGGVVESIVVIEEDESEEVVSLRAENDALKAEIESLKTSNEANLAELKKEVANMKKILVTEKINATDPAPTAKLTASSVMASITNKNKNKK